MMALAYPHSRTVVLIFVQTGNCDLEFTNDILFVIEAPTHLRIILRFLNDAKRLIGMCFDSSEYVKQLQNNVFEAKPCSLIKRIGLDSQI